jgi:DNA-binding CsgD family transcriptional regulator
LGHSLGPAVAQRELAREREVAPDQDPPGLGVARLRASAKLRVVAAGEVEGVENGHGRDGRGGARSGEERLASDALERLREATTPSGTDWGLGVEARARALVGESAAAERLYREAIDGLGGTRIRVERARAHLLYGEWLRRERRRLDARSQLRAAHDLFAEIGAEAFADRAARELLATGETARERSVEASDQLTAQGAHIARLARDGMSNPEIGARLFISPRTVEYHLLKVFTKLGIASRSQLAYALPGGQLEAQPVS